MGCAPNAVEAVDVLNPNAEDVAVEAAGWPKRDGVVPSVDPNPPAVPNKLVPAEPKAGIVDVLAVLPNPLNPEQMKGAI